MNATIMTSDVIMNATTVNNDSLFISGSNVTDFERRINLIPEYQAAILITRFCPPVIFLLGVFGNLAAIVVLFRLDWKGRTLHLYLVCLALSDLCILFTGLVRYWLSKVFQIDVRNFHSVVCKFHMWLTYSAGTASAWFLVFVTIQRTVAVTWPHHVHLICSPRRSKFGVIMVVLASCCLHAHLLYGMQVIKHICQSLENDYHHFLVFVFPWIDVLSTSGIPSLFLGLCNACLVRKLRHFAGSGKNLGTYPSGNVAKRRSKMASSMTVTLAVVSATFLALTLPITVFVVWYQNMNKNDVGQDERLYAMILLAEVVTSMLWYANSSVNFFLYCLSGKKFRNEFVTCVCFVRRTSTDASSPSK